MSKVNNVAMVEDLRSWGIGLLILGVLHFFIPVLSAEWGMVLIPLGILSLVIQHRGMFILIGLSLILVGILNIAASLEFGGRFWMFFGGMQIYWGFKEMVKFSAYENTIDSAKGKIAGIQGHAAKEVKNQNLFNVK